MDMNTAFDLEVRAHYPQAEIVYDLFHVLAKYRREVTDRVRVDQANALRDLWSYRHRGCAERAWQSWYRKALRSGVEPLIRLARKLRLCLPGILAHARFPLGTNPIEGINNRIKVIKRMAYGYRDEAYFFLKIRVAFPGIER